MRTMAGCRPLRQRVSRRKSQGFQVAESSPKKKPEDGGVSDYLENAHGRVYSLLRFLLFVNRNLKER